MPAARFPWPPCASGCHCPFQCPQPIPLKTREGMWSRQLLLYQGPREPLPTTPLPRLPLDTHSQMLGPGGWGREGVCHWPRRWLLVTWGGNLSSLSANFQNPSLTPISKPLLPLFFCLESLKMLLYLSQSHSYLKAHLEPHLLQEAFLGSTSVHRSFCSVNAHYHLPWP